MIKQLPQSLNVTQTVSDELRFNVQLKSDGVSVDLTGKTIEAKLTRSVTDLKVMADIPTTIVDAADGKVELASPEQEGAMTRGWYLYVVEDDRTYVSGTWSFKRKTHPGESTTADETYVIEIAGPQGAKGDKGDQGDFVTNWQGDWDSTRDYDEADLVSHDGSSWVATQDTNAGDEPGVSAKWDVVAEQGQGIGTHEQTVANHDDIGLDDPQEDDTIQYYSGSFVNSPFIKSTIDSDPFLSYVYDSSKDGGTVNDIDSTRKLIRGIDS